ncbi:unnamed protein product [Cylindrotheca closterium]|uniref:Uncharacterized protein n=1 Tax=Cylindrotheca closterium TaxID=2856 RepID=A0AAD2FSP9_9STRA|nr:unnamed protein product [Cylindrotheca closterium]
MREMNRWGVDDTSPVRSTKPDHSLRSLSLTPERGRQESKDQPAPFRSEIEPHDDADCVPPQPHTIRSGVKTREVIKRHCRTRSRSLDILFSSGNDDIAPSKPKRVLSKRNVFRQEGGNKEVGHRRMRSRSLHLHMDSIFAIATCEKSRGMCEPPPSLTKSPPQDRESAETKHKASGNKKRNLHRRTRSRSLDLNLLNASNLLTTNPTCENPSDLCYPTPSWMENLSMQKFPNTRGRRNSSSNHRGKRSRSIVKRDLPPSPPDRRDSHKIPDAALPTESSNTETKLGDQRTDMCIAPSFPQRELLRRISSLTMDNSLRCQRRTGAPVVVVDTDARHVRRISSLSMDDSLRQKRTLGPVVVADTAHHVRKISSLTMDESLRQKLTVVVDAVEPNPRNAHIAESTNPQNTDATDPIPQKTVREDQDPHLEETNGHVQKFPLVVMPLEEEKRGDESFEYETSNGPLSAHQEGKENESSEFETSKASLSLHQEIQAKEKEQSALPPPPPPPTRRYTPPSPLCFMETHSRISPRLKYNRKNKTNKPKLSPFAYSIRKQYLAASQRYEESKEAPPAPTKSPRSSMDSMSHDMWLLADRTSASATQYDETFDGELSGDFSSQPHDTNKHESVKPSSLQSQVSRKSSGSDRNRFRKPPFPLQTVSTFLMGWKAKK